MELPNLGTVPPAVAGSGKPQTASGPTVTAGSDPGAGSTGDDILASPPSLNDGAPQPRSNAPRGSFIDITI